MNVTLGDLTSLIYAVGTAVAMLAGGWFAVRKWLRTLIVDELKAALRPIEAELRHNGGNSLKDDIAALRRELAHTSSKLDRAQAETDRRHRENRDELERLNLLVVKLRRTLLAHLRLDHRQAHAQGLAQAISDRALEELDEGHDLEHFRRRRPREEPTP